MRSLLLTRLQGRIQGALPCVCAVAYVENLCGQLVAVAVACLALPRRGHLRGVASSQRGIVVAAAVAPAVAA